MGRTILKGRTGVLPKACFTRETHYSVQILRELLGLETVTVGTLPDVGMDPDDLAEKKWHGIQTLPFWWMGNWEHFLKELSTMSTEFSRN